MSINQRKRPIKLDEAALRGMASELGVHPDNIALIFDDLADTEALVDEALDLGVAFDFGGHALRIAFPKTMPPATQNRLAEAITAKSVAVSWLLDARVNGVESAFAAMFEDDGEAGSA